MSMTDQQENATLSMYFENAADTHWGSGFGATSTAGSVHIALHTSSPGDSATAQTTNEAAYTGYSTSGRQAVARSTAGWTVASGTVSNDAAITFSQCTTGSETETHFSIGEDQSGTGYMQIWGALTTPLSVSSGVTPQFAISALQVSLD